MTHDRIRMAVAACTVAMTMDAALGLGSRAALAQCQYEVTEVEPFPCQSWDLYGYTGHGLNNLGAWCGYREMCGGGAGDLPIYCPPGGTPQVLPMPPGAGPMGAQATAVNDAGVVVGFSFQGTSGSIKVGCIWWPDGTVEEIPAAIGMVGSQPFDVTNSNMVVGLTGSKPYRWEDGVLATIDVPPPHAGHARQASDSGFVVGIYGVTSQPSGRGFRWRDGIFDILPPAPPHLASSARDVTNKGVVVGSSTTFNSSLGYFHAPTLWIGTDATVLPLPPGYMSGGCYSINEAGTILGFALPGWSQGGGAIPVLWIDGSVFKLGDLLVAGTSTPGLADLINNASQLLGGGSAKLFTPTAATPADLDGDCAVDGADIAKLLSEWGPREWSVADLDSDGIVNGRDLGLVLGAWTGSK